MCVCLLNHNGLSFTLVSLKLTWTEWRQSYIESLEAHPMYQKSIPQWVYTCVLYSLLSPILICLFLQLKYTANRSIHSVACKTYWWSGFDVAEKNNFHREHHVFSFRFMVNFSGSTINSENWGRFNQNLENSINKIILILTTAL